MRKQQLAYTNTLTPLSRARVAVLYRSQSRLTGMKDSVEEVRKQYAREYRERRRLFNVVQVCVCVCVGTKTEKIQLLWKRRNKRRTFKSARITNDLGMTTT